MIKIRVSRNKIAKVRIYVEEDPSMGTYGNLLLLKEEYKLLDETWVHDNPAAFSRMKFNENLLTEILNEHGELHCEYCGRPDLEICYWPSKIKNNCATIDHFIPVVHDKQLLFDRDNLLVACLKCNNKKGEKIWPKEKIKFPYKFRKFGNENSTI